MAAPRRRTTGPSGFWGVLIVGDRFLASAFVNNKRWTLGMWATAEQAAVAVDRARLYFGVEGRGLNLPRKSRRLGSASPGELLVESRRLRKEAVATSRYFGVYREGTRGHWITCFSVGGQIRRVARFDTELEAAIAHDRLARYYHGSRGNLNFPKRRLRARSVEQLRKERNAHYTKLTISTYRGVMHVADASIFAWRAIIQPVKRLGVLSLGSWETAEQAAIAYDRAVLYYYGERAKINFDRSRKLKPLDAESLAALARRELKKRTYSRFHGVSYDKSRGQWFARIQTDGHGHFLGFFQSEEPAALAYDREARRLLGARAKLNFHPITREELLGRRVPELGGGRRPKRPK